MSQIKTFIDSLQLPTTEPVFLCGDYNVDAYENHEIWTNMLRVINMRATMPKQIAFSFDPSTNTMVGNDDENEYKLKASKEGCYSTLLETGVCSCCPRQLLDGTVVSLGHLPLLKHETKVLQVKAYPFTTHINASRRRSTSDVSDHYAVETTMFFVEDVPWYTDNQIQELVENRERIGTGVSDDGTMKNSGVILALLILTIVIFFLLWTMLILLKRMAGY